MATLDDAAQMALELPEDTDQRETLYNMLQQVMGGDELRCTEALN